jgi:hypothetical protein
MTGAQKLKAFALSPWHAWTALVTLGAGLASADPWYMVLGTAAYLGAWVLLPDTPWFKAWLARRERARLDVEDAAAVAEWQRQQRLHYEPLTDARKQEYGEVDRIANDIARLVRELAAEGRAVDTEEALGQVDSLVWTFLRLLKVEQDQLEHLAHEHQDDLPSELARAEAELAALESDLPAREEAQRDKSASARIRIAFSQRERIGVLRQRLEKLRLAEAECDLVRVEKARILDLFKLLRADLLSSRDLTGFSSRIDQSRRAWSQSQETFEHLDFLREEAAPVPRAASARRRPEPPAAGRRAETE